MIPTTPVKKYPIIARVRATRQGRLLEAPITGEIGVIGRDGGHYYNLTIEPASGGGERLTCSCPAFRYGRAHIVQRTGMCKHMHKIREHMLSGHADVGPNRDWFIHARSALTAFLGVR